MIQDRNLAPGTKLVAQYRKQPHRCEVVEGESGKLRYRLEDGREYKSPSAAGMAITGKSCNGWAFWSVEMTTAPDAAHELLQEETRPSPETEMAYATESPVEHEAPAPAPDPAEATLEPARKCFFRTPNQKGVPEGQTRWYCHDCGESFLVPADETPESCPQGHQA